MKTSLILICALMLCYSCSKDDVRTLSTGNYESAADIKNDPVVLYTKGKIITDTAYIQNFLERNQIYGIFDSTPGMTASPIHVTFDNRVADSVFFGSVASNSSFGLIFNQVYYENNTAVFMGRDSLPGSPAADGELSCSNVAVHIRKHPLLIDCIPSGISGALLCKTRYQMPVIMNDNNITLPVISYYFNNATSVSSCTLSEKYAFGLFNADAVKTIHTQDTLVVQTKMLVLEKK